MSTTRCSPVADEQPDDRGPAGDEHDAEDDARRRPTSTMACTTPRRMRSGRPPPRFCATNIDTARPRDASSATARPSTRTAVVYAATASEPSSLRRTCTASVPIAMIDAWNPIGRPSRRCRRSSTPLTCQSSRCTCRTGTRRRTNARHSATDTPCETTVDSAAPATPMPEPADRDDHQDDVQDAADGQEDQRRARVADRPDDRRQVVEEHHRAGARGS